MDDKLKELNSSYDVSDEPYGKIIRLGILEGIPILSLTHPGTKEITPLQPNDPTAPALSLDYLKLIYKGLKQSFACYSDQLILYYLYKRPGVNGLMKTKQLCEICGLSESLWKKSGVSAGGLTTERRSTGGTENEEPIVKIQDNNNTSSLSEGKADLEEEKSSGKASLTPLKTNDALNLLEFPSIEQESYEVKWSVKDIEEVKKMRESIAKGESSLIEAAQNNAGSADNNSLCTNNVGCISEEINESSGSESIKVEEVRELSRIGGEELVGAKEKNTFIDEIGLLLKEIGGKKK